MSRLLKIILVGIFIAFVASTIFAYLSLRQTEPKQAKNGPENATQKTESQERPPSQPSPIMTTSTNDKGFAGKPKASKPKTTHIYKTYTQTYYYYYESSVSASASASASANGSSARAEAYVK
jgi:hypothetical protein